MLAPFERVCRHVRALTYDLCENNETQSLRKYHSCIIHCFHNRSSAYSLSYNTRWSIALCTEAKNRCDGTCLWHEPYTTCGRSSTIAIHNECATLCLCSLFSVIYGLENQFILSGHLRSTPHGCGSCLCLCAYIIIILRMVHFL